MKLTPLVPKGKRKPDGFMLSVTTEEAYELISSLTIQMLNKNSNAGRTEFFTDDGLYFSTAVNFEDERKERQIKLDAFNKLFEKKFEEGGWAAVTDEMYGTDLEKQLEEIDDKTNNKR